MRITFQGGPRDGQTVEVGDNVRYIRFAVPMVESYAPFGFPAIGWHAVDCDIVDGICYWPDHEPVPDFEHWQHIPGGGVFSGRPDEAPGMTVDELIDNIDALLEEYRS